MFHINWQQKIPFELVEIVWFEYISQLFPMEIDKKYNMFEPIVQIFSGFHFLGEP